MKRGEEAGNPTAGILLREGGKKITETTWRNEVIALHDEIPVARLTTSQIGHIFEQVKRHLVVMIHHRIFSNPIHCRHINRAVQFSAEE